MNVSRDFNEWSDHLWDLRDKRVDGWFMLDSFWPTLLLVGVYFFIVKFWGPWFMEKRPPYNITAFLVYYNACQVGLSTYIFVQLLRGGWSGEYSFLCQPVDYSQSPQAMLMLHACHIYYLSKFSEFIDTFCFVIPLIISYKLWGNLAICIFAVPTFMLSRLKLNCQGAITLLYGSTFNQLFPKIYK